MTHHMMRKTGQWYKWECTNRRRAHTDTCTMDMAALERRLQKYIDEKFVQLQRQIDERFEELMKMILDKIT